MTSWPVRTERSYRQCFRGHLKTQEAVRWNEKKKKTQDLKTRFLKTNFFEIDTAF